MDIFEIYFKLFRLAGITRFPLPKYDAIRKALISFHFVVSLSHFLAYLKFLLKADNVLDMTECISHLITLMLTVYKYAVLVLQFYELFEIMDDIKTLSEECE